MRTQAAKDRRALKRERNKYMPNMSFRAYVKANSAHIEREAERKKQNAEYALQILESNYGWVT